MNCTSLTSDDSYFPADITIQAGTTIPSWAGTNPTAWTNAQFDVNEAKGFASQGKPDLSPTRLNSKKSTPVGAIAGGVVGGVLVLCAGAVVFWFMRRRKNGPQRPERPIHGRSMSDLSQKTATTNYHPGFGDGRSYATSPTVRTHSSSAHSISHFGSAQGSIFSSPIQPPARLLSPPPPVPLLPMNREDVIEPFIVSPTSPAPRSPPPLRRKASSDTSVQPVVRVEETIPEEDSSTPGRRRVNPPAYTPSPYASQTQLVSSSPGPGVANREIRGHRPGRGEKGSQDTQTSWDSYGSRSMGVGGGGNVAGDAAQQIGFHIPRRSVNTVSVQHSRQTSAATTTDHDMTIA